MKYDCYYMRPEFFAIGILGAEFLKQEGRMPDPLELDNTHIFLMQREAENLEDLFRQMQGENWSPKGEARPLIESKGLAHTSMSVGDVAVDQDGVSYLVDMVGWVQLDGSSQ